LRRFIGIPWLFAVGYLAVGFSLYFSLGIVSERGLGLTPLIFLGAGVAFVLTTFTYTEGGAMYAERGGSNTFARHAFNELIAFIAGWAVLIDYIIIIAIAAITVPAYLTPISPEFEDTAPQLLVAAGVIGGVSVANAIGSTGALRRRLYVVIALADFTLQIAVIVVGVAVVFDPGLLTQHLEPFESPTVSDAVYAAVIATVALAGIESASSLAPDLELDERGLRRVVNLGLIVVPILYAAIAAVALMAVPVVSGPDGPATALGGEYKAAPLLGVVQNFDPAWVADGMQWAVVLIAPVVLIWAASISMLGLSRHVYALATARQIPSWLGKLGHNTRTPYVAIWVAAVIAFGFAIPTDIDALAGLYAFGITLAVAIAHLSVIRLRYSDPERRRPYRIPLNVRVAGHAVPLPAVLGVVMATAAWISVIAIHDEARWVGGGWMTFGLVAYVIYRRFIEGTSLTGRVDVPAEALTKKEPVVEHRRILVPVFGTRLDDDIVGTAGRLAAAADAAGREAPRLEIVYVLELPLAVPLDAPPPPKRLEEAERALTRAADVGGEYEAVDVHTHLIKARNVGAGIVEAAGEYEVEAIVLGAEPPTRIRGGSVLGGVGASRPPEIGEVTEYVLRKSPCRVLLTAPPE
jgi:basic amino acid/polyamine antiporter, APA family